MHEAAALLHRHVFQVTERMFRKHFGIPPPEVRWLWDAIVAAGNTMSEGELLTQRSLLYAMNFLFRYPTCDEMEIFCGLEHKTLMPIIWATLWAIHRSVSLVHNLSPSASMILGYYVDACPSTFVAPLGRSTYWVGGT